MSDIVTTSWSETDGSNNQFPPEGWPTGMFPNAVEPSARMNMGAVKRFWNRMNPVYAATQSTTDTFVVSPSVAPLGYGLYERWRVRFPHANTTSSPTVNISSLGAIPLRRYNAGNVANVSVGDVQAQDHGFWWDGSEFILENPANPVLTNALPAGVTISSSGTIYDGPVVAQGTQGTWFASGQVLVAGNAGNVMVVRLWDGSDVLASAIYVATGNPDRTALSGSITDPVGNLRLSVQNQTEGAGIIYANQSSLTKDSVITAFKMG